jgi:hypothetical protein
MKNIRKKTITNTRKRGGFSSSGVALRGNEEY